MMIPVIRFEQDMTVILPCRDNDYVIHFSYVTLTGKTTVKATRVWQLYGGDVMTVSNRRVDLPQTLVLSGEDATNSCREFMQGQPADSIDCCRILAGERLFWLGKSRPGQPAIRGILSIIDMKNCAIALQETKCKQGAKQPKRMMAFEECGPLQEYDFSFVKENLRKLGLPRCIAKQWSLGE